MNPKVSLFASAVRPELWPALFKSLDGTSVAHEVVFAGNVPPGTMIPMNNAKSFKYIGTGDIKPSQCYEIARRACEGETVVWIADDCEFPNDVIGRAYEYWKSENNEKLILSIQTKESGYGLPEGKLFDMNAHRFFGFRKNTPLMAPLGMMSRKFLDDLSGIDRRYICGQYENDIVQRAYAAGGKVEIFGGPNCFIDIDHLGKSIAIGESKTEEDFLHRPFATGYGHDRNVFETSWTDFAGFPTFVRNDKFEAFEEKDLLTRSQGPSGKWA